MAVTNVDIFDEFINTIRSGASKEDILKEYGGSYMYVPSYKRTYRDEKIKEAYGDGMSVKQIAKEFMLSTNRIYEILSK